MAQNCPCTQGCPLQSAMAAIGGKWKLAILCALQADGAVRYNELKRKLQGISNTMLAQSLKDLEDRGLVARREFLEVPIRVEYTATPLSAELLPILQSLAQWGAKLAARKDEGG